MSAAEAQPEPTMEEILASIRRIISEGDPPGEEARPAEPELVAEAPDDILDLTEALAEEPEPLDDFIPAEPEPLDQTEIDDLLISTRPPPEPAPEPAYAAPPPRMEPRPAPEPIAAYADALEPLVGEPAAAAAVDAFSRLSMAIPVYTGPEATLETVVKDLLRPMLKAWLDEHLPAIVEAKVEAEVARLARTLR